MSDQHKNFSYSTVATAPSPATSGTSLVVATGDGAKFPTVPFNATVWPVSAQPTTANAEIVRVTAISTDTLTITRAQESSSARTVIVGDQIAATVTAKTLTDVELNVYVTDQDKTIPATTEVIFETYLELSASFFYELSTDAILVIGDFATPLALPNQHTNIFVTAADETVPANSEIIFSDFYELSAPFSTEVSGSGLLQLGTGSSAGLSKLFDFTLGADAGSIDTGAGAIPPGYGSLLICAMLRTADAAVNGDVQIQFNGDTAANYGVSYVGSVSGTVPSHDSATTQTSINFLTMCGNTAATNAYGVIVGHVVNYASPTQLKVFDFTSQMPGSLAATMYCKNGLGFWNNTAPVNRIVVAPTNAVNLKAGSSLTIYGMP